MWRLRGLKPRSQCLRRAAPGRRIPAVMQLQWHVTERCNLACAHCYQANPPAAELDLEALHAILEQFRELAGSLGARGQITLTGGEPFVRPDFGALLERVAAARAWTDFAILTNGTLIDAARARALRKLNPIYVQVSIDGTEPTHEALRGPGSWRRAVEGLGHLAGAGVHTLISFTAHGGNYREFPAVADLGRRLGVARVWADRLVPLGSRAGLTTLSPGQTREFIELMRRARAPRSRTEVALHRALQFRAGGGRPYRCSAGESLLAVMPDGEVYPCRRLPLSAGNLRRQTLAELYRESEVLRALREPGRVCAGCEGCLYAGLCRGGLRCLAWAATGDPFTRDPGCWREAKAAACPGRTCS